MVSTPAPSALAITSQGEKVSSNVRIADQAYEHFKRNGEFPTNIEAKSPSGDFIKDCIAFAT
jgi:hypothetical protein